jgi:hypothetical protein
VTGERLGQAGWRGPSQAGAQVPGAEAGFTSSSGTFARVSYAKSGTWRSGTMRNRSASNQVAQAGFEPGRIAVTQRVIGCYCVSARGVRLWRIQSNRLKPPNENHRKVDKRSARTGKTTQTRQIA